MIKRGRAARSGVLDELEADVLVDGGVILRSAQRDEGSLVTPQEPGFSRVSPKIPRLRLGMTWWVINPVSDARAATLQRFPD